MSQVKILYNVTSNQMVYYGKSGHNTALPFIKGDKVVILDYNKWDAYLQQYKLANVVI